MIMSKNVVILLGLIVVWLGVVKLNSNINNNQTTTQDTTVGDDIQEDTSMQTTTAQENTYVQVSKQNAVNTKSMYIDNTDLAPFGRSYTS